MTNVHQSTGIVQTHDSLLQQALNQWLAMHHGALTHAATFTFNERRVWRFIEASAQFVTPHDEGMIALLRKTMRLFQRRLERSLYGNAAKRYGQRLLFIPMLEGLRCGEFPHYHAALGVDEARAASLLSNIKRAWTSLPFAGHHIELAPYRDQGWLSYSTKAAYRVNQHSIDWESVSVPLRSPIPC